MCAVTGGACRRRRDGRRRHFHVTSTGGSQAGCSCKGLGAVSLWRRSAGLLYRHACGDASTPLQLSPVENSLLAALLLLYPPAYHAWFADWCCDLTRVLCGTTACGVATARSGCFAYRIKQAGGRTFLRVVAGRTAVRALAPLARLRRHLSQRSSLCGALPAGNGWARGCRPGRRRECSWHAPAAPCCAGSLRG